MSLLIFPLLRQMIAVFEELESDYSDLFSDCNDPLDDDKSNIDPKTPSVLSWIRKYLKMQSLVIMDGFVMISSSVIIIRKIGIVLIIPLRCFSLLVNTNVVFRSFSRVSSSYGIVLITPSVSSASG